MENQLDPTDKKKPALMLPSVPAILPAPGAGPPSVPTLQNPTVAMPRQTNILTQDPNAELKNLGSQIATAWDKSNAAIPFPSSKPSTRWNMAPSMAPTGDIRMAYAATPGGDLEPHPMDPTFYRPRTGPHSAENAAATQAAGGEGPISGTSSPIAAATTSTPTSQGTPGVSVASSGPVAVSPAAPAKPVIWNPRAGSIPAPAASPAAGQLSVTAAPNNGAAAGGVDVGGNHLNYGAMVNGVPTFSDGTAGMPNTMGKAGMAQLAQQRSISRADVGAAGNVLASDVTGSPVSTADRVATLVRNANVPITGSRPTAQQFADSERLSVANRDWRSAAGIAAGNLATESQYGGTAGARRGAAGQLAQLTQGVDQSALLAGQGENQQAVTQAQGQNQLANTALQGQNQMANTALTGENQAMAATAKLMQPHKGVQVKLDDGTFGLQDPITGAITRSTLPDGSPAKALTSTAPIYTSQGGQKALSELTNNILGVDPLSGMVKDPAAPGGARLPSNAEQYAAMLKAQQQLKVLANGGVPDKQTFLNANRQANPGYSDAQILAEYEKKYGKRS